MHFLYFLLIYLCIYLFETGSHYAASDWSEIQNQAGLELSETHLPLSPKVLESKECVTKPTCAVHFQRIQFSSNNSTLQNVVAETGSGGHQELLFNG